MVFESMMFIPVMGDFDQFYGGQRARRQNQPCFTRRCQPVCCQNISENGPDFGLDLLRDFMLPFIDYHQGRVDKRKQTSKNKTRPKCSQLKRWSEEVELPQGFLPRHLISVSVDTGKVTFILRKMGIDCNGFQDLTAKRQISLPENILESSIKVVAMKGERVKIVGLIKIIQEETSASNGDLEQDKSSNMKRGDEEVQDSSTTEDVIEQPRAEQVDDTDDVADDVSMQTFVMLPKDGEEKEDTECCQSPGADCSSNAMECKDMESCCGSDDTSNATECTTEQQLKDSDVKDVGDLTSKDFSASLQMTPFHPKEITIKLTGRELLIDAVHKDEEDGQMSSFEMHRSLMIPENVNLDQIITRMTDGGELIITAPYMDKSQYEREIAIDMEH